jgi:hypothetical protein
VDGGEDLEADFCGSEGRVVVANVWPWVRRERARDWGEMGLLMTVEREGCAGRAEGSRSGERVSFAASGVVDVILGLDVRELKINGLVEGFDGDIEVRDVVDGHALGSSEFGQSLS